jgi:hypothetical protein
MIPARFLHGDAARARFGAPVDRLAEALTRCDPLADAAVEAFASMPRGLGFRQLDALLREGSRAVPEAGEPLHALVADAERTPVWVDAARIERGARFFMRSGLLGGIVLGAESLVLGYASPGGNKPLVWTGALEERAARRVGETARFVEAVARPGGLVRSGAGFAISVKVRVMHAEVRRLIRASGRFRVEEWGEPINQHDMSATILLFSVAVLDGLGKLGLSIAQNDADDFVHLWAYVAHLMGVEPALIPHSAAEGRHMAEMIAATQGPPDDDSRALTRAYLEAGLRAARNDAEKRLAGRRMLIGQLACRALLGDSLADALAIPRRSLGAAIPALRFAIGASQRALQTLPRSERLDAYATELGEKYWHQAVTLALGGEDASFRPPERLREAR